MTMLTPDELAVLLPAETASFSSPVPPQVVSSDELFPVPRTERQKKVEARMKALGPAQSPVKTAIFGTNSAKMYKYDIQKARLETDRVTIAKAEYDKHGPSRSNLRYGYVVAG